MRDYLLSITLILSGDISLNPGPVKNPCFVCFGPVARNHRAVSCDNCVKWTHIKCEGINPRRYKAMVEFKIIKANGNFTYVCKPCISSQLPFYCLDEDEFFYTLGINVHCKVYSYTEADFTSLKEEKELKILHLNINGLLNKLDQMKILAQEIKFDILCLNETKLDARIGDNDICIT